MKSVFKILAWLIGLFFILVIVAAVVLPMMVDPNDYREQIGEAVAKQTGRELVIEGELSLSVVPWLGVEVGRASLSNAPGLGDEPMLAIEGASVGVRLMPLLSRRLEVSEITLDGLRLNLHQGADGTNWDDLAGTEEAPAEPAAEAGPGFDMSEVGGIRLRDARVSFVDAVAGSDMEATIGEFSTGRITAQGQSFNIDGISLDDAGVSYSDKETGVLKATLGSLSTGAIMADPDSPDVSDLRLGNAAVELGGGSAGTLNAAIESLAADRVRGTADAPELEGLDLGNARIDFDDGQGQALMATIESMKAGRLAGTAQKPVLEAVALAAAEVDYRGAEAGTVKGNVRSFSVDRLVGDAEAPLLEKLILEAADFDYDDGESGRFAFKAERVEADNLKSGPDAPVIGRTVARNVNVSQAGDGGFELALSELSTGGAVADPDAFQLDGLTVSGGTFEMDQGETGRARARIDNLTVGTLRPGSETPLSGRIEGSYGKPVVNFTTAIDGRARMDDDGTVRLSGFAVDVGLKGEAIPGGSQDGRIAAERLSVNTRTQVMDLAGLTVDLAGLSLKASAGGEKIIDAPLIKGNVETGEFSPRELMTTLGVEPPATADPAVLDKASVKGSFVASEKQLTLSGLTARLDDTTMRGNFSATTGEPVVLRATLKVNQIDVDRYLAPEDAPPVAEEETGAGEIDVTDLRKLDAEASLDIGTLKVSGITLTQVTANAVVKDGQLVVSPLGARLYGGAVDGKLTVDGRGTSPRLQFNQALTGVQVGGLLGDLADVDRLTGKAAFNINLDTAGSTQKELLSSLDGDMNFELTDGVIRGFNITHGLQTAVALFDRKAPPAADSPDTVFQDFRGSARVQKGVVRSDDLSAVLPNLNLTGAGAVDLANQTLDYRLKAAVPRGQAAKDAGLGKLAGKSVPVMITGTLDDPSVNADVGALIATQVESFILKQLGGGKDEEEAGAGTEGESGSAEDPSAEPAEEEEPQSPEDAVKEGLKKLFGG
jgi:AsmA protein